MKRLFIILAAAVMAVSMMAQETIIATNILGVKLGYSTKTEVDNILTSQGFEFVSDISDTINYGYIGKCQHEGMEFGGVVTRYLQDSLIFLGFYGSCDSACTDYGKAFTERIHAKYNYLPDADTTLYGILLTSDAKGSETWTKKDDRSLIVTIRNDTLCACIYFANERVKEIIVNEMASMLKDFSPDYAKENKVTGVAGVKFGDSRETVRKTIFTKADKILESDAHSLNYYKVKIGGVTYDFATFYFSGAKGLVSVNMQSSFYSWRKEEAKMAYESVKAQYSRKYTNFKVIKDDPEEKACTCGAFIDGYDYAPIIITFQKSLSRGGDIMYYVEVDYYHARRKGMYDDEI